MREHACQARESRHILRDTNQTARALYVADGLSLAGVAARLGVTERTVQRWKSKAAESGDDWDKARTAARIAPENVETAARESLEIFLDYHRAVLDEVNKNEGLTTIEKVQAVTSLADAYSKHLRASAVTMPKVNRLAIATDVLQSLAAFVSEKAPSAAPVLAGVLEAFGPELARLYE